MNPNLRILISGGGSGGHIFPAIAIANAIRKKAADAEILFVGAKGKMEMTKVPAAGYDIKGLWISGFQRKITLKNLIFPVKLIFSLIIAAGIIRRFKPSLVIGVGGFASGPVLNTAVRKNIPTLIQEQNSFPGITNRLLAKKVRRICVAYSNMEKFFPKEKIILTGNPVRQDIVNLINKREDALKHFGLSADKMTVLVIGGSLGAGTINESICNSLDIFANNNIQLVWQTGKFYFNAAENAVGKFKGKGIYAFEFINEMDFAYAVADIVISRAGAIAISELCAVKKPVILIPSPNVAEDHQTKNAMVLVNKNAALMIKDSDSKRLLGNAVLDLIYNTKKQNELMANIGSLAITDAADRIADEVFKLIHQPI